MSLQTKLTKLGVFQSRKRNTVSTPTRNPVANTNTVSFGTPQAEATAEATNAAGMRPPSILRQTRPTKASTDASITSPDHKKKKTSPANKASATPKTATKPAAAAKAEAEKLRAEFEAKFKAANQPAPAEERAPSFLEEKTALVMMITPARGLVILALTSGMCLLAGRLALRKVQSSDPAELFS